MSLAVLLGFFIPRLFRDKSTYKIDMEYHSVSPLLGIGTSPPLLPQGSVPPPGTKEGGTAGEGVGESQHSDENSGEKAYHSVYSVDETHHN